MDNEIELHFYDQVLPSYVNYIRAVDLAQSGGLRIMGPAKLLSEYLFHLRDRLEPNYPSRSFTRKIVAELYPDFNLIGDVANALKHGQLTHKPDKLIKDVSSIQERLVWVHFRYANSRPYSYLQPRIMVKLITGEYRDLLEVATGVLNFWCDYLFTNGYIKSMHRFLYTGDNVFTESQANAVRRPNVNVEVPMDYSFGVMNRVYNGNINKWQPYR